MSRAEDAYDQIDALRDQINALHREAGRALDDADDMIMGGRSASHSLSARLAEIRDEAGRISAEAEFIARHLDL